MSGAQRGLRGGEDAAPQAMPPARGRVLSPVQAICAAAAILAAAVVAHLVVPRDLMAVSTETFDLQQVVPRQFGEWTADPRIRLIAPPEPDSLARQLYSQEVARGYRDREGNLVMLLVAYGPNQFSRLQLHRPEICYAADGFRVSKPARADVNYRDGAPPLKLLRLTARREARVEPISYWMRVGDDISTNVVDRQLIKLKLALRGKVPDGALIRVSTIGLSEARAYEVQDRFIREFSEAIAPENRAFFFGGDRRYAQAARAQ